MPLKIIRADITKLECDAIVNPTNMDMMPSGGVDAAIHEAAGQELLEYCKSFGGCGVGEAKISPAFNLPSKFVIHTVGPMWEGGEKGEALLLRSCYSEAMKLAIKEGCKSVAFPLISSGLFGYPKDRVLKEATDTIGLFLTEYEMDIYIVVYDKESFSISRGLFDGVKEYIDNNYIDFEALRGQRRRRTESEDDRVSSSYSMSISGAPPSRKPPIRRPTKSEPLETEFLESKIIDDEPSISYQSIADDGECSLLDFDFVCKSALPRGIFDDMDKGFADTLFYYIDKKGFTDVEAYKRSNVSKKTFSKIKCTPNYNPSKITAVSFAIGLRLNIEETRRLLRTAGICLSRSNKFDVIIEYFIVSGNYNSIFDVNEVLYQFDQLLLGV